MLKLVSSNVCYFSKIVDDLFLCPEFLIRGFPANNVLSLIGLFIDTSRGAIKLIRSSLRPHFWQNRKCTEAYTRKSIYFII